MKLTKLIELAQQKLAEVGDIECYLVKDSYGEEYLDDEIVMKVIQTAKSVTIEIV